MEEARQGNMLEMHNNKCERGRAGNREHGLGRQQNTRRQGDKIAKTAARKNWTECDIGRVTNKMCDIRTYIQ